MQHIYMVTYYGRKDEEGIAYISLDERKANATLQKLINSADINGYYEYRLKRRKLDRLIPAPKV